MVIITLRTLSGQAARHCGACRNMAPLLRGTLLLVMAATSAALVMTPRQPVRCVGCAPLPQPRSPAAAMGLMDWLSNLLYEGEVSKSRSRRGRNGAAGSTAVSRLKVVLASDRTGLDDATLGKIRAEIQEVIAKYVVIDVEDVDFNLVNDDQLTLVTATFPLKGTRPRSAVATPAAGGLEFLGEEGACVHVHRGGRRAREPTSLCASPHRCPSLPRSQVMTCPFNSMNWAESAISESSIPCAQYHAPPGPSPLAPARARAGGCCARE